MVKEEEIIKNNSWRVRKEEKGDRWMKIEGKRQKILMVNLLLNHLHKRSVNLLTAEQIQPDCFLPEISMLCTIFLLYSASEHLRPIFLVAYCWHCSLNASQIQR